MSATRLLLLKGIAVAAAVLVIGAASKPIVTISDLQFRRNPKSDAAHHWYDYVFTVTTDRELDTVDLSVVFYNGKGDFLGYDWLYGELPERSIKLCGTASVTGVATQVEVDIEIIEETTTPRNRPKVTTSGVQTTRNQTSDVNRYSYDYWFTAECSCKAQVEYSVLFYDAENTFLGCALEQKDLKAGKHKLSGTAVIAGKPSIVEVVVTSTYDISYR